MTLNSVPEDRVRSIDKRTFEGISTHTREQASKDTSIGDFGLNVERDVLRAVIGTPDDQSLGSRLAGRDNLTATCKVSLETLPDLLAQYLAKSTETTYKTRYPWVDNILEVRDKTTRAGLDEQLVKALHAGGDHRIWLAVPDLVDWTDVDGFVYSGAKAAPIFPDLHVTDYLNTVSLETLSDQSLRRHHVQGIRATSGYPFGKWSVYECLYAEIELPGETYLLTNGEWYRIDNDFVAVINNDVRDIPQTDFQPIDYEEGEGEAAYNKRLTAALAGSCCLDARMITYGGGRSTIEFCDVYSPHRQLIHVKRYAGSSVLSHLFSQGVVSATSFVRSSDFRKEVNKLLPKTLRIKAPNKRPNPADYEIAYLVASRTQKPLTPVTLPFFSRVTLRNARSQLAGYNFRVTFTKVQAKEP